MKKDIHPLMKPAIFVDTSSGAEFFTLSTATAEKTRAVDGVIYQVINIEISSASHPFYTGKQVLVDSARRVEKFQERAAKRVATSQARLGKKVKRTKAAVRKKTAEITASKPQSAPSKKTKKETDKK